MGGDHMTKFRLAQSIACAICCFTPATQGLNGQSQSAPMGPMPLVAPLFIQNATTSSAITLVSNSTQPMMVDVVLTALSGAQLAKTTVPLAAHSQMELQVAALLQGQALASGSVGSVTAGTMGTNWTSLAAQLSITQQPPSGAPVYLEEEFLMLGGMGDNRYRAVAVGASAPPALAIRNLDMATQSVAVTCIMEGGATATSTLSLAPGRTAFAQVCAGPNPAPLNALEDMGSTVFPSAESVGVSVLGSGMPATLAVYGLSPATGGGGAPVSALQFSQTSMAQSASLIYAGVPVGTTALLGSASFQPQAAVTNFGAAPATVTVDYSSSASNAAAAGNAERPASLTVPAGATVSIPFGPLQGDPMMRNSFIIASDAPPGQVYSSLRAVSGNGIPIVANLMGKDAQEYENAGEHPWTVGGGTASTLLLFNPDKQAARIVDVLVYSESVEWVKHYDLAPQQTLAIGVGDLVANREADILGNKLPAGATSGIVLWSTPWRAGVIGRLVQTNASADMARNFSCGTKTTLCGTAVFTPSSLSMAYGSSEGTTITGPTCTGPIGGGCGTSPTHLFGSGSTYYWLSQSPSVITGPSAPFTARGNFQGVGAGQGTFIGTITDTYLCQASGGGAAAVTPTITGGNTIWWFNGQAPSGYPMSVTLTSAGGSPVNWAVLYGADKVKLSAYSGVSVTASSTGTAFSGAVNDVTVQATINGKSGTLTMTTRRPYQLVAGGVINSCDATYGYSDLLNYTIRDQLGAAMPSPVPLNEFWTTIVEPDYTGTNWRRGPATGYTTSAGTPALFADHIQGELSTYTPTPGCGGGTTKVEHWGQDWYIGSVTPGIGGRVQSDTLQKYQDHAIHTGITSPNP